MVVPSLLFDQLLIGVKCHTSELIGREEEEEVVHARNSLPLLTYRCKFTINGIPQDTLEEWMRTIDFFFNTTILLNRLPRLLNET